jgi:hypothetical protein
VVVLQGVQSSSSLNRPRLPRPTTLARLLAAVLLLEGTVAIPAPQNVAGEELYREGQLPGGALLHAERAGELPLAGPDAACVHCHGRSGLGAVEGRIVTPPIAGRLLFHPGERLPLEDAHRGGTHHVPPTPRDRPAYDDATLARAIREGVGVDGRALDYLMPHYDLDDAAMRDLIDYLRHLSSGRVPGVSDSALQFATIVTPDADPVARDGMVAVLERFFAEKNSFFTTSDSSPLPQGTHAIRFRMQRLWQLHVWQLQGSAATWEAQLEERLRREPVFAVISGLGGSTWEPVHRFCEREAIPCLLPNVDLPVVARDDFYPIYFSQGLLLEARLVATRLRPRLASDGAHSRIVQVFRSDDSGAAAAAALREDLPGADFVDLKLQPKDGPGELARALKNVGPEDTLVLWLRPADLARLPEAGSGAAPVYVSGLMGGLERAPLPPTWRSRALIMYPYALPSERSLRLQYPLGWFHFRHIPVVAERVQVNTYVACQVLAEAVASMLDEFVRDYLVERVEAMLDSRIVNGYYTRLGLASGQHFASKGGYLVRFAGASGASVVADGGWIVPD